MRFAGALYLVSNAFEVQVGRGQGADQVWQRVDGGANAGRGLTVFTPFTKAVLGEVVASSNPFTPNGDGINDVVELVFPVFQVQGAKALILEVYGLDGQSVQRIEQAARDRRGGPAADLGWARPTGPAAAAGTVYVSRRRGSGRRRRANYEHQTRRQRVLGSYLVCLVAVRYPIDCYKRCLCT